MTWSRIHSAPLRVLPKPRPASSSQVRQSPFGACWLGRPHQPQSCSIASSSRSLVCFRNAASCCGGSDASNSAHETFSDSDNFDLDRITVRRTGVFVGAGFAPAAARLHPEDRGRDAGTIVESVTLDSRNLVKERVQSRSLPRREFIAAFMAAAMWGARRQCTTA